jgi:hypothetical protein
VILFKIYPRGCHRYLPGATYDGWPIRIEGTLLPNWIKELNGDGTMPPEKGEKENFF